MLSSAPIYFPQFVDGGGYNTSLMMLNTSNATETGVLKFFDDNGSELVVHERGGSSQSTFRYAITSGGGILFQADGASPAAKVGWVQVLPDTDTFAPIGAGVFSYSSAGILVTEAGIPSSTPTNHARIYVDKSAGHETGLAIGNPATTSTDILVSAFQMDGTAGVGASDGALRLSANAHKAKFVGELISGLPDGFVGVLDILSTRPFVALTLRSLMNARRDFLLTAFPIADFMQKAPTPACFPQIADGGGYLTQFVFLNSATFTKARVSFFDDDGVPLPIGK